MKLLTVKECRGYAATKEDALAIANAVGRVMDVKPELVMFYSKEPKISACKQMAYSVMVYGFGVHPAAAGYAWSRDRTTILYGVNKFKKMIKHDPEWLEVYSQTCELAQEMLPDDTSLTFKGIALS